MVILFDVNSTLLDTEALAPQIREIFGRKYTVREWFTEVIQYSMATTLSGSFREFADIAIAVLDMAAAARHIRLSRESAEDIRVALQHLPPFDDVKPALGRLRRAGFRLAALSNSSQRALDAQIRNAGLAPYFEKALSVDSTRVYKPAPETYRAAAVALRVRAREILMVAAHPWDLMGAARAGLRTAFLARPGEALITGVPNHQFVAGDLEELASQLLGTPRPTATAPLAWAGIIAGAVAAAGYLLLNAELVSSEKTIRTERTPPAATTTAASRWAPEYRG